ncbi:VanZ family protein [Pseudomonadota bacterium]
MKYTLPALFFLFILWIIYEANQGNNNLFITFTASVPYGDKLGHIGLYGVLTLLINLASRCYRIQLGNISLQAGTLAVLVFSLAEELSQGLLPTRTLDMGDAAADIVGIMIGAYVAKKLYKMFAYRRL